MHDIGGLHGFGSVPAVDDIEGFHHEWEARVFAINRFFLKRGTYNLDEFRLTIESLDPETYASASYYEKWLLAIETLLRQRGIIDAI